MGSVAPEGKTVPMKNLTVDNITENVIRINSGCEDPRAKYLAERLVTHLHDFARETRLSTKEWMAGLEFLTACGQKCDEFRQVRRDATIPALLQYLLNPPIFQLRIGQTS